MTLEMHLFTVIRKMVDKYDVNLSRAIDLFIDIVELDALNYSSKEISKKIDYDTNLVTFVKNCQKNRKENEQGEDIYYKQVLDSCTTEELDNINKQKDLIVSTLKNKWNQLQLQS